MGKAGKVMILLQVQVKNIVLISNIISLLLKFKVFYKLSILRFILNKNKTHYGSRLITDILKTNKYNSLNHLIYMHIYLYKHIYICIYIYIYIFI